MKFDPQKHHRRSTRLKGYEYDQPGAYFVTLCAWQRDCLFGEVVGGAVRLNPVGSIVEAEWKRLPRQFPNVRLDAFVVMPNHIHGIIVIAEVAVGVGPSTPVDARDGSGTPAPMVGATRDAPVDPMTVRATHPIPPRIYSNDAPLSNEAVDNQDGSPLPAPGGSPLPAPVDPMDSRDGSGQPAPVDPMDSRDGSGQPAGPAAGSLGAIIGQFKSRATKRIWALTGYAHTPIWQRNYYEHIIRNEDDWRRICKYIQNNPLRWDEDQMHPTTPHNPFKQDE